MNNIYIIKKTFILFLTLTLCTLIPCYLNLKFTNISVFPLILISLSIYLLVFKKISIKEQFSVVKPTIFLNKFIIKSTTFYIIFAMTLFFIPALVLFPRNPYINLNWITLFINLFYLIIGAFQEEIVFRAYAFHQLKKLSLKKQLIFSSFIFSILHLISPILSGYILNLEAIRILLFTFSAGLFIAVIYAKNKNLIQVSLIHLSINLAQNLISIFFIDVLSINLFKLIVSLILLISSFLIFKSITSNTSFNKNIDNIPEIL
ncbi:CPBP family intramembrane metalloprotease [Clostridium perfringens]|nr:CPBP family intramembrane metalloprotease [Clostridium perfringens]